LPHESSSEKDLEVHGVGQPVAKSRDIAPSKSIDSATGRWRKRWNAFRHPLNEEKMRLLRDRWDSLPQELRMPNQIAGRHMTHCGFILGASYCSFHCTHCYLPKNANRVPIPSLAEMKDQIDANRRFQGPGGGLQITGGDVADAYWRSGRQTELVEIVRYAVEVGLVPMLMTHGQTLIENPEFLEELIVKGGLRQLAVHIDMTQIGRHGYRLSRMRSEADLHPLRAAFTKLALEMRASTRLPIELAHNCTVTERNINFVPDIVRWFLSDPQRSRVWRILSFQPEADTGRTTISKHPVTPALVWEKICQGIGMQLDGSAFIAGHPKCNQGVMLLIARRTGGFLPLIPTDVKTRRVVTEALAELGALSTMTTDGDGSGSLLPYRIAGSFAQRPALALRVLMRVGTLIGSGQIPFGFVRALAFGQAHTLNIGTHNFMDAKLVANSDHDAVVRARLNACVFKGAVKENGEWHAVPMCAMNQQKWSETYNKRLRDPALLREPQVFETKTMVRMKDRRL